MATKAEIIAALNEAGVSDTDAVVLEKQSKEVLEQMLADTAKPELVPARRKVNRGSTRRINRAAEGLDAALVEFAKEIGTQCFLADEKGERVADHPLVSEVAKMREFVREAVSNITTPPEQPADPDADTEYPKLG